MRPVESCRILFAVLENQPAPTVRVLHIRNVAQRAVGEPEDSEENRLNSIAADLLKGAKENDSG
jgi:hypothetical protein